MKVYIGPYKGYFGIYDIAYFFEKFGVSEDKCHAIGEKLEASWFGSLVRWINDVIGERKIKVKIHDYDTWSMDQTLAFIILPMLKQLKETKHGSGHVDDKDVPKHLRSTSAPPKENEWDIDAFYHDRWDWALDEMIWAFEQVVKEEDTSMFMLANFDEKAYKEHSARLKHGLMMFGKYYQSLWD